MTINEKVELVILTMLLLLCGLTVVGEKLLTGDWPWMHPRETIVRDVNE